MVIDLSSMITIIVSIFASTGFWSFLSSRFQHRDKKKDKDDKEIELQSKMLKGLGHDRIVYLGNEYLKKKYITKGEYENLYDYLYLPYKELGGNGTAEKIMREVDKLPIKDKEDSYD